LDNVKIEVRCGAFGNYTQEILDPRGWLYEFNPDVLILAIETRDLVPELWDRFSEVSPEAIGIRIKETVERLRGLITLLRKHTGAHIVLHTLAAPPQPAWGALNGQAGRGQSDWIYLANRAIRNLGDDEPRLYILDYESLVARSGRCNWWDEQKWLTMRMPLSAVAITHLAHEWARLIVAITGKIRKVLVMDLDNTLWGGTIGEDGMSGIDLGPEYPGACYVSLQRTILDLSRRGIILAICSKNNEAEAMRILREHPAMLLRPEHLAAWRINWNDKAGNLREIAAELNIRLDSFVFLDDSPAERARVAMELPEVLVIDLPEEPSGYGDALRDVAGFERFRLSGEDLSRTRYYAADRARAANRPAGSSLAEFLHSLQIVVNIGPVTAATFNRTVQLIHKTNQFNLTAKRYSEDAVASMIAASEWRTYSLNAWDRFGDNGLVGLAFCRREGAMWNIDNLLLSCRIIGRGVETALLSRIAGDARAEGASLLRGELIKSTKNTPAIDFYPRHGFQPVGDSAGATIYQTDLTIAPVAWPDWITNYTGG
jgi:FkbH-like protein